MIFFPKNDCKTSRSAFRVGHKRSLQSQCPKGISCCHLGHLLAAEECGDREPGTAVSQHQQPGVVPLYPAQGQSDNLAQRLRAQEPGAICHGGSGGAPGAAEWPCWGRSGLRDRGSHGLQSQKGRGTALGQLCSRGAQGKLLCRAFCPWADLP